MHPTPYQKRLRKLFESLLDRTLTSRDGACATKNWPEMPRKLREFYELVGRLDKINQCHNRLYRPARIQDEGDYRIFMEENQTVVVWAFKVEDARQDNPRIYQAACLTSGELDKWYPAKLRCSDWLVAMVYWQVVNGGFRYGAYKTCKLDLRRRISTHWPLIMTVPDEGPMTFYGRNGQLLCWSGRKQGSLYAAGRTRNDLVAIDQKLGVKWNYSKLDDF